MCNKRVDTAAGHRTATLKNHSRARYLTRWAAQFAVAGELCKRGYEVALTMGSTAPEADLMVVTPLRKKMFLIDVKGQSTKSFWRIREKTKRPNLFYILAHVPLGKPNRFFVLPQRDLSTLMSTYEHSGVKFDPRFSGINWTTPFPYEDKWELLPK